MSTRFWNGLPGIICQTCKGTGQERYKVSELPAEFNACGGRYEGDMFIRKCIKCDGIGAFEDLSGAQAQSASDQMMYLSQRMNRQ